MMSVNNVCCNCGSSSFVSDRSLGGRLVCARCGSSSFRKKSSSFVKFLNRKKIIFLVIVIAIFIVII